MSGGVSHLDTFDPKPALEKYAGQPLTGKGDVVVRQGNPGPLMPSPFQFRKYGQCGMDVSEIFPLLAQHVDELAFLRSVYGKSNDHVQATYELNTGKIQMGLPSVGSWVTYGLGSENQSLPAFVVIYDHRGGPLGRPVQLERGIHAGGLPGDGLPLGGRPDHRSEAAGRGQPGAAARPARSARQAQRARSEATIPAAPSWRRGSRRTSWRTGCRAARRKRWTWIANRRRRANSTGWTKRSREPFGRQCLMARRLVERGVRFVQLYHGGLGQQNRDTWDAHDDVKENHTRHAAEVDRPISGLLTDLKARGLLDDTLVVWHGEFGRMPISQKGVGRDHNPGTMTMWMAGAGIKGGQIIGSSDEFGYKAEQQPIAVHDLHATMLHLLGIDHTRLTYLFNGRNMRLTDVYGELIPQIAG